MTKPAKHQLLEDQADLEGFESRRNETTVTYQEMLKNLKRSCRKT